MTRLRHALVEAAASLSRKVELATKKHTMAKKDYMATRVGRIIDAMEEHTGDLAEDCRGELAEILERELKESYKNGARAGRAGGRVHRGSSSK